MNNQFAESTEIFHHSFSDKINYFNFPQYHCIKYTLLSSYTHEEGDFIKIHGREEIIYQNNKIIE